MRLVEWSEKGETDCAIPTKSVYALLKLLFMGVTVMDEEMSGNHTSTINVSYRHDFVSTSQLSALDAQNLAARKAIKALCDIENKFTQHKHNDELPRGFGQHVEKYGKCICTIDRFVWNLQN